MSPILGIYASQISGHLYAASYESLQTVTVGAGGAASVTFSSIPQTYKHLQIRWIANQATSTSMLNIKVNNDTGGVNAIHSLTGDGSTAGANNATSVQYIRQLRSGGVSATASTFSVGVIDILDYANTSKLKTFRMLGGTDKNGSGTVDLESGLYPYTTAITDLSMFCTNNFNQYTQFALYGIKDVA